MRVFVLLILLAFLVRLAATAWLGFDRAPAKDEVGYIAVARNIAAGQGFYRDVTRTVDGDDVTRRVHSLRPPLYPLLLAGVFRAGGGLDAARLLSCLLGALTVPLLFTWGKRLPGAWLAAALLIVWPSHVWASGQLLSEPLYILLIVGAAARLTGERPLSAGLLLGLAVLARPIGLLLLLPAVLFCLLRPSPSVPRRRAILLLVVPALLLPLPWVLRNAAIHGRPLLTTNLGVTFLGGNSEVALTDPVPGQWHLPEEVLAADPPDMGYYGWSALTEVENNDLFLTKGLAWVRANPGRWLRLVLWKGVRFFDPDQHSRKGDRRLKRALGWVSFGPLLLFSLAGLWPARRRWRETLLVTGAVAMPLLAALIFYGDARARLPAVPALLLLGAWAATVVATRLFRCASGEPASA